MCCTKSIIYSKGQWVLLLPLTGSVGNRNTTPRAVDTQNSSNQLTWTRTVKRSLSWGGEPRLPGYSQSRSSPSNWYWRRNVIALLMKVWRLAALETIAVNLETESQMLIFLHCFIHLMKALIPSSYFWVPRFHPPMASRVFRLRFLQTKTTCRLTYDILLCVFIDICVCLLILQGLELCVEFLIIPLIGGDHVVSHVSKSIDEVVTETWVNVGGQILSCSGAVLCPVSEIAGEDVGRSYNTWVSYITWSGQLQHVTQTLNYKIT